MSSPALARPRPSRTAAPARYRHDRQSGSWWWSPEMHDVLGHDAVGTRPCIESLVAAHHPDDRGRIRAAITSCGAGRAFVLEARVVHPTGAERVVVLQGRPARDGSGNVRAVEGVCLDVTGSSPLRSEAAEVQQLRAEVAQLRTAMASRATIEQAKGVLMLLVGCGEQTAFDLLAHLSSHTHQKVRTVAELITGWSSGAAPLPEDVRRILQDACPPARPAS